MPVMQGPAGVAQEMHKFKHGQLHSGSPTGPIVHNRRQAVAIAMSQAGMSNKHSRGKHGTRLRDVRNHLSGSR